MEQTSSKNHNINTERKEPADTELHVTEQEQRSPDENHKLIQPEVASPYTAVPNSVVKLEIHVNPNNCKEPDHGNEEMKTNKPEEPKKPEKPKEPEEPEKPRKFISLLFIRMAMTIFNFLPNFVTWYSTLSVTGIGPIDLLEDSESKDIIIAILSLQGIWIIVIITNIFIFGVSDLSWWQLSYKIEAVKENRICRSVYLLTGTISLICQIKVWTLFREKCFSVQPIPSECQQLSSGMSFAYTCLIAIFGLYSISHYNGSFRRGMPYDQTQSLRRLHLPVLKIGSFDIPKFWLNTNALLSTLESMVILYNSYIKNWKLKLIEKKPKVDEETIKKIVFRLLSEDYNHFEWQWILMMSGEDLENLEKLFKKQDLDKRDWSRFIDKQKLTTFYEAITLEEKMDDFNEHLTLFWVFDIWLVLISLPLIIIGIICFLISLLVMYWMPKVKSLMKNQIRSMKETASWRKRLFIALKFFVSLMQMVVIIIFCLIFIITYVFEWFYVKLFAPQLSKVFADEENA